MPNEKFEVTTTLSSYIRKKDQKPIPYIMVNGLICRTQGRIVPDADGNVIGKVEVSLIKKGDKFTDGTEATVDSYNLVDFVPDTLVLKQAELKNRKAKITMTTAILNRQAAEVATMEVADLWNVAV